MSNQLIEDKIPDQDNYEVKANEVKYVIKEPLCKEINK
jgi:hypothetical protein